MKLMTYKQLVSIKGIPFTQRYLRTLMKEGKFPKSIKLITNGRIAWDEKEIDDWLRGRAEMRQPVEPLTPPPPPVPEPGNIGSLLRRH